MEPMSPIAFSLISWIAALTIGGICFWLTDRYCPPREDLE